jgi:hypothetical protein
MNNSFLTPPMPKAEAQPGTDADTPKGKLAQLKRMIEAQEQATADLKTELEAIDKPLQ